MPGSTSGSANIRIEPVKVLFGKYQMQTVTTAADISSSHNNDYFVLYNAKDVTKYHVWYNVGGAGVDPAPVGSTAIPVAIAVNATATVIAAATATAIEAVQGFTASYVGAVVTVCNTQPGLSTTVASGVGLVGFSYALTYTGSDDDLGYCDGDIEIKVDEKLLDITAHQTGTDILTSLRQGKTAEISVTFKETDTTNMQYFIKQAGNLYTPPGGTEIASWGTATNSQNVITGAGKLVLHPVALSSSDRSRDLSFWKSHLKVDSIKYSGEKEMLVSATFKCYTDDTKINYANLFVLGDHMQSFDNQ